MLMRVLALVVSVSLGTVPAAEAQFAIPAPVASGENFNVELGGMLWWPAPELRLQTGAQVEGDDQGADFAQEFGLERRRLTEFRMVLKPGLRHRLRFSYLPVHYEQETITEGPVTFGEATFLPGEPASVDIRWDQWRFGYQYDLASAERALFGIILELRRDRVQAEVLSDQQGQSMDQRVTVPRVGFMARGYFHPSVALTLEFAGLGVPGPIGRWITDDDIDVTVRDLDLYVTGNASRHFGVQGGYRYVRTDYLIEQNRGDLRMRGWYLGALIRF